MSSCAPCRWRSAVVVVVGAAVVGVGAAVVGVGAAVVVGGAAVVGVGAVVVVGGACQVTFDHPTGVKVCHVVWSRHALYRAFILIHSLTHPLPHSPTHSLTHSLTTHAARLRFHQRHALHRAASIVLIPPRRHPSTSTRDISATSYSRSARGSYKVGTYDGAGRELIYNMYPSTYYTRPAHVYS